MTFKSRIIQTDKKSAANFYIRRRLYFSFEGSKESSLSKFYLFEENLSYCSVISQSPFALGEIQETGIKLNDP